MLEQNFPGRSITPQDRRVNSPNVAAQSGPVTIEGLDYHPLYPPVLYQSKEGELFWHGGKLLIEPDVNLNPKARVMWRSAVSRYPTLADVIVRNFDDSYERVNPLTLGTYVHPEYANQLPTVYVTANWLRVSILVNSPEARPFKEAMVSHIGIDIEQLNDALIASFVILHEGGHFLYCYGKSYTDSRNERIAETSTLPAKNIEDFRRKFPSATLSEIQEFCRKYRLLPSELSADRFAGEIIRENLKF